MHTTAALFFLTKGAELALALVPMLVLAAVSLLAIVFTEYGLRLSGQADSKDVNDSNCEGMQSGQAASRARKKVWSKRRRTNVRIDGTIGVS